MTRAYALKGETPLTACVNSSRKLAWNHLTQMTLVTMIMITETTETLLRTSQPQIVGKLHHIWLHQCIRKPHIMQAAVEVAMEEEEEMEMEEGDGRG
jgi:hypothetical protein